MADRAPSPPGTVAVMFASDAAHYTDFNVNLDRLTLPAGTEKDFERGLDRITVMNKLVERALERGFYWVWFIDEDHSFEPDIVEVLLARNEAIVAPISIENTPPYRPESYVEVEKGGLVPLPLDDFTGPGSLIEVASVGIPGLLVRRAVFEAMEPPWFRRAPDGSESLWFCTKARDLHFQPYVDSSARLGNYCTSAMFPSHRAGKWEIAVSIGEEVSVNIPFRSK